MTTLLRFEESLQGKAIKATDGEIGKCTDLLFDERYWTARYLVVKTGGWLFGRELLVPIVSASGIDPDTGEIEVNLTKKKISDAPDIDTDAPVSRQHEIRLFDHYSFGYYWALGGLESPGVNPRVMTAPVDELPPDPTDDGDPDLRSVREVIGYDLNADGDRVASIADVFVCPPTWYIKYLVISIGGLLSKNHRLFPPEWTTGISWADKVVRTDANKQQITDTPDFTPPLTRAFEQQLEQYFERQSATM